jgi:hypothetical protein
MLASMREAGEGTCGCVLRRKARDLAEDCPFSWWPKLRDSNDNPGYTNHILAWPPRHEYSEN